MISFFTFIMFKFFLIYLVQWSIFRTNHQTVKPLESIDPTFICLVMGHCHWTDNDWES